MKEKHHGFTHYPSDWIENEHRMRMTHLEQNVCWLLMNHAWNGIPVGTLPDDDSLLFRYAELPSMEDFRKIKARVMVEFLLNKKNARWEHPRLLKAKANKDEWVRKSSEGGKRSAEIRRLRNIGSEPPLNHPSNGGSTTLEPPLNHPSNGGSTKEARVVQAPLPLPSPLPFPSPMLKDTDKQIPEFFEILWNVYPPKGRDGKKQALRHYNASVKTGDDLKDIQRALENYLKSERVKSGFVKNGSVWFNNWRDWIDWQEPKGGTNGRSRKGFVEPDLSTY